MQNWRELDWLKRGLSLTEIAAEVNVQMKGIFHYYGKFNRSRLGRIAMYIGFRLAKWAMKKYKRLKGQYRRAFRWLKRIKTDFPNLFYHWAFF